MSLLLSLHGKGCVRTDKIFWCHKHRRDCVVLVLKFQLARSEVLNSSVADSSGCLEYLFF